MASRWLWCIFQLPLISGLRIGSAGIGRSSQCREPGQVTLLEVLQRGSPAGGHVVHPGREAELGEGSCAVAAADNREAAARRHRFRDRSRARRESLVLEDAHGPVPEDSARLDDGVGELRGGPGPDVEPAPTLGNVAAYGADLGAAGA